MKEVWPQEKIQRLNEALKHWNKRYRGRFLPMVKKRPKVVKKSVLGRASEVLVVKLKDL